jgi:hypothetical protein
MELREEAEVTEDAASSVERNGAPLLIVEDV